MLAYLIRRLLTSVALLFFVSVTVFALLFVLPGDPAQVILGVAATPETLANLRADLGLDRPAVTQYLGWMRDLFTAQNRSIHYDLPVSELLVSRLAVTGPLALLATLFAVGLALPCGVYAARHRNRPGDLLVVGLTQLGLATPEFWLGMLLILLLSVEWGLFPAGGFPGWSTDFAGSLKALVLPAFALGFIRAAILTRLTRSSMLEVLSEDCVRTARAKGLGPGRVVYGHALSNAAIPVLTVLGLQLGQLLTGAIIIENVYHLPGLGRLLLQALGQRDLPVVRDAVLWMAAAVVMVNFLVDAAYAVLDPRLRTE